MERNKTTNIWERVVAHAWLSDELNKGNVEYRYADRPIGIVCALMNLISDRERSTRGKFGILITSLILWVLIRALYFFLRDLRRCSDAPMACRIGAKK